MTWSNVQSDCLLCEMDKRTHWYKETDNFVVAEKLGGGPFIVVKHHTSEIHDSKKEAARAVAEDVFPDTDFEIDVRMGLVEDHWHGHLVFEGTSPDLSGE